MSTDPSSPPLNSSAPPSVHPVESTAKPAKVNPDIAKANAAKKEKKDKKAAAASAIPLEVGLLSFPCDIVLMTIAQHNR